MCDPSKPEGAWISHIDIVEKGKELKLVDTGSVSVSGVCLTSSMKSNFVIVASG